MFAVAASYAAIAVLQAVSVNIVMLDAVRLGPLSARDALRGVPWRIRPDHRYQCDYLL